MKCAIPEISWHNRDPVLSVDIQPMISHEKRDFYRLASGGTDSHVLIWYMTLNDAGSLDLDLAADLTRHQRAVNVVKWSPNGDLLASGDDESVIFIWKLKGESEIINIVDSTNEQDKEIWLTHKILRGHMEDVYDLSWSPNSLYLISGSVDNTAIIWDVSKGKLMTILGDHKGFVQGVAWDPQNKYLATLSTDRYLRIFDIQTKKVLHRVSKCGLPVPKDSILYGKSVRLFHDDTLQTFFRRLCFSPDGKLLIVPSGVADFDGMSKQIHLTYIFSKNSLKQPAIVLPSPDQYTIGIAFNPVLYKLRPHSDTNRAIIPLPYRMIFSVATKTSVYLYDTQQTVPFGIISNIHYTRLTDLTWSANGKVLVVSSTDGFCSLITFTDGELGEVYLNERESKENKSKLENDLADLENSKISIGDVLTGCVEKTSTEKKTDSKYRTSSSTDVRMEMVASVDKLVSRQIISSDEKFELPEKKNRPVTPISIRRHPRSPSISSPQSEHIQFTDFDKVELAESPKTPQHCGRSQTPSSKSSKKTPSFIAIRRQPRNIISGQVEKPMIVEEAIDAWPLNESPPKIEIKSEQAIPPIEPVNSSVVTNEYTEDICLIYEESQDDANVEGIQNDAAVEKISDCKTPRRVPLKTISTPKSKKNATE